MSLTAIYQPTLTESSVKDYISLLKPRVMSLVVFTGAIGLFLAPGHIHPFLALITIFCIALGSGASGAINMWYDRDIDAVMKRTMNRAIPSGKIHADEALGFGIVMSIASVVILAIATNPLAAGILAAAILFYVFIYTMWLKRLTPQNIVIGGAAGSFPPMIGWAAVTGDITAMPLVLFAIIFLWTPPHFWALSLLIKDDYRNAAVPMLPVVKGERVTKNNILFYTVILVGFSFVPYLINFSGNLYLIAVLPLDLIFLYYAWQLFVEPNHNYARRTFTYSILYLFLIYLALLTDKIISHYVKF